MGVDEVMVAVLFFLFLGGGAFVLLVLTIVNTVLVTRQERRIKALEARLAAGVPVTRVESVSTPIAPTEISQVESISAPAMTMTMPSPLPETAPPSIPATKPHPASASPDSLETRIGSGCLARIGVVAVIIGMGFFLKLAIDYGWVGPAARVLIGVATGIAFLGLGWRLIRRAYVATGIALTGGALAILYFSLFAAFAFYSLVGQGPAFAFMILVTAIAVALSIKFDSRVIALLGLLGGFLTPIMLSTGKNSFVPLCSYILMLDLAFLALARWRDWKWINVLAFFGTLLLLAGWADEHYTRAQFPRTLSWFTVFFVLFWLLSILPRIVGRKDLKGGSLFLMTTNSLVYFAVGAAMVEEYRSLWTGTFTLGVAAIHIVMAGIASRLAPKDRSLSFLTAGLSIFFLTMVFPMQYDDDPVILAWIVEAVILMTLGARLRRPEFRIGAWIMLLVAGSRLLAYGSAMTYDPPSFTLLLNKRFGLILLMVLASFGLGAILKKFRDSISAFELRAGCVALLILANAFALWGLTTEAWDFFDLKQATSPEIARERDDQRKSQESNEHLWKLQVQRDDGTRSPEERAAIEAEIATLEQMNAASNNDFSTIHGDANATRRRLGHARSATLSILWALYSILMIAVGIATRSGAARLMALTVFGVTIFKVFLYDLSGLETIYRVISFIGLGVLLIAVSLLYTRFRSQINDFVLSKDDQ